MKEYAVHVRTLDHTFEKHDIDQQFKNNVINLVS